MIKAQLIRLAKGSVVYGIGGMLNRFLSFFLIPVFTRYLNPEDYGIMAMLSVMTMLFSGLFSLGTGNALGICYFGTENKEDRRKMVWSTCALLLVNSGLLLLLAFLFSKQLSVLALSSPQYYELVILSFASLAISNIVMPLHSYLRMEERAKTYVAITVTLTLLTLSVNIYAVVFLGMGVRGIVYSGFISSVFMFIISIGVVGRMLKPGFDFHWIPKLVKIGYPSIFGVGAFFIIGYLNRFLLQRFDGLSELGLFSLGYSFGMVMFLIAEGAFGAAWPPYFISFLNKRDEARVLFGKVFKYAVVGYGLVVLLFFIMAEPVVKIMTAPAFHSAYTVVGFIAAACVLKVCYLIMLPGFYFEAKLHIQTGIEWTAALIALILYFILIPLFHKEGAAIATVLAYLSLPLLTHFIGKKYFRVHYEWKRIGIFLCGFVSLMGLSFIPFTDYLAIKVTINIAFFITFIFFTYFFVLTREEKESITKSYIRLRQMAVFSERS